MRRYVLTGASGAGKSSLIVGLKLRGEAVVHEAARELLLFQQACGNPDPMAAPDWEDCVVRLHLRREASVPPGVPRVFLDRGGPDHVVYSRLFGWPLSVDLRELALGMTYDAIFLIEHDRKRSGGEGAASGRKESEHIARALLGQYEALGHLTFRIPLMPLGDRLEILLGIVCDLEHGASL
jgi:predicted ATPase